MTTTAAPPAEATQNRRTTDANRLADLNRQVTGLDTAIIDLVQQREQAAGLLAAARTMAGLPGYDHAAVTGTRQRYQNSLGQDGIEIAAVLTRPGSRR